MKAQNIFLFLLIILLNGCLTEKHLEFENVPINGTIDQFADELIKLGFTEPQAAEGNQIILNGVFSGKNCEIFVHGTGMSKTAYKVTVNLPREIQNSLENSFRELQEFYSGKYGKGTNRYQQYRNSARFHFNEPRLIRHLNPGDLTRYTTDSGLITIQVRDRYISITYLDKWNNEIRKQEMN